MCNTSVGNRKSRFIVCLFFLIYFIVGLSIYSDYGISADELPQHKIGVKFWGYVLRGDFSSPPAFRNKVYGAVFEMLLIDLEHRLKLENPREIFFMRHFMNFLLFFVSVWFFYLLCKNHFGDYKIGLLGALVLILSPRIFADSFYNSKDLPFLSLYIICMYTLLRLSDRRSLGAAAVHALSCALLIDIRIPGVIMVVITLLSLGSDVGAPRPEGDRSSKAVTLTAVFLALLIPLTIAFWPYLWHNPATHFMTAFRTMSRFSRWPGYVLYLGDYIKGTELPWHYIPLWLIITTPLLYVFNFFVGLSVFLAGLIRNPFNYLFGTQACRRETLFFLCFFLPLFAVIAFKSVLYNGWRQMFFIYPAFLLISLSGLTSIFRFIRTKLHFASPAYQYLFFGIIVFSVSSTAYSMIEDHPYQNVYFNDLVSEEEEYAASHFVLDYWGLSYRKALEYILSQDNDGVIDIEVADTVGKHNALLLEEAERERLRFVETRDQAQYYVTHEGGDEGACLRGKEVYSIKVHGSKIIRVYKLR